MGWLVTKITRKILILLLLLLGILYIPLCVPTLILNIYSLDMSAIYREYLVKYFYTSIFTLGTTGVCLFLCILTIIISILQMAKGSCCKLLKHCFLFFIGCLMFIATIAFIAIFVIGWIPVDLKGIKIDETHRHELENEYDCCYESYIVNKTTVFSESCGCQYLKVGQNVLDSDCTECISLNDYHHEQKTLTIFNEIFVLIQAFYFIIYTFVSLFYSIPYFIKVIKKQKWYDEL